MPRGRRASCPAVASLPDVNRGLGGGDNRGGESRGIHLVDVRAETVHEPPSEPFDEGVDVIVGQVAGHR